MDLQPVSSSVSVDDIPWLASRDGVQYCITITLDLTKFTKGTHYPDGIILSGLPLVQDPTSKLYGPAASGATVSEGHLMAAVPVYDASHTHYGASLFWRGVVDEAHVPVAPNAHAPNVLYRNLSTGANDDVEGS